MTNPNEPTLICSEVVERLQGCITVNFANPEFAVLNRAKAEAILHSWRERRVQELEECLRDIKAILGYSLLHSSIQRLEDGATKASQRVDSVLLGKDK